MHWHLKLSWVAVQHYPPPPLSQAVPQGNFSEAASLECAMERGKRQMWYGQILWFIKIYNVCVCVCMCIYDVYFQVTTAESKTALKLSNYFPTDTCFQHFPTESHEFNEPMEFEESREPTAQRASNDSIPSCRIVNIWNIAFIDMHRFS